VGGAWLGGWGMAWWVGYERVGGVWLGGWGMRGWVGYSLVGRE